MRAKDIMTHPVVTVTPDVPIREAAALLVSHGFTALPVVDVDRRMVGIVTEADLLRSRYDTASEPPGAPVAEVMTTPAFGMGAGSSVELLARVMLDDRVRCLPIVDSARVVGVVTRRDLVRALARSDTAIADDVRHRLEIYGGSSRWSVTVHDGEVTIGADSVDAESRRVASPVVVVRGAPADDAPVVVGVDGSPASEAAIEFAFDAASTRGVPLKAVMTWTDFLVDSPYDEARLAIDWEQVQEAERRLLAQRMAGWQEKYPDVDVDRTVVRDRPVRALLRLAEDAQLLVVGTRGHGGFTGMLLGSTSQALVYHAPCPLAVVRPVS